MRVELTYFKGNGKYYSTACYITDFVSLLDIWHEVRRMLERGELPGLVEGAKEFIISIEVPNHPHNHPHLINVAEAVEAYK